METMGLVSQMLTYSRKNESKSERVFIDKQLRVDVSMLRASVPSSIEIKLDIGEEYPPSI